MHPKLREGEKIMTTKTYEDRLMAETELKRLANMHGRFTRWHATCDALATMRRNGVEEDDAIRVSGWSPRKMPSKTIKHRMYDSAARLHMLLDLPGDRPHTLDEIALLIKTAKKMLYR